MNALPNEVLNLCDLDAEKALLGSMMMSREVVDEVMGIIPSPTVFYEPAHASIYGALAEIHEDGKPMDLMVVTDWFKRNGMLDQIGGQNTLIELAESFGDWANAAFYARIVVDFHRRRKLYVLGRDLQGQAANIAGGDNIETIAANAASESEAIIESGGQDQGSIELGEVIDRLPQWWSRSRSGTIRACPLALDDQLRGFEEQSLVIVGARPSIGKTAFAVTMALQAAATGTAVAFFVIESGANRVTGRFVSHLIQRSVRELRAHGSPDDQMQACAAARLSLGAAKIYLNEKLSGHRQIIAEARALIRRKDVKLVIVDYLQLVTPQGKYENRNLEVSAMSKAFKDLARTTKAVVVLLAQLSRDAAHRRPMLSDLRDSGSLEQDADVVIFLHRETIAGWEKLHAVPTLIDVAKNRDGPTFEVGFDLYRATMTFAPRTVEPRAIELAKACADDSPF